MVVVDEVVVGTVVVVVVDAKSACTDCSSLCRVWIWLCIVACTAKHPLISARTSCPVFVYMLTYIYIPFIILRGGVVTQKRIMHAGS